MKSRFAVRVSESLYFCTTNIGFWNKVNRTFCLNNTKCSRAHVDIMNYVDICTGNDYAEYVNNLPESTFKTG